VPTGSNPAPTTATTDPADHDYLVILIVDDDGVLASRLADQYPAMFGAEHVVRQATSMADAVPLFRVAPEADVILVDGWIQHGPCDGLVVMRRLRNAGYSGPFIAISSDEEARKTMVEHDDLKPTSSCSKSQAQALAGLIRELVDRA
jgi:CheY-like chemotaxis protein